MNLIEFASGIGWGIIFGTLYFGGLWLTVRYVHKARNPNKYLLTSFFIRIFLLMAVIWLVTDPNRLVILPLMAGFLTSRFLMIRIVQHGCTRSGNAPQP